MDVDNLFQIHYSFVRMTAFHVINQSPWISQLLVAELAGNVPPDVVTFNVSYNVVFSTLIATIVAPMLALVVMHIPVSDLIVNCKNNRKHVVLLSSSLPVYCSSQIIQLLMTEALQLIPCHCIISFMFILAFQWFFLMWIPSIRGFLTTFSQNLHFRSHLMCRAAM